MEFSISEVQEAVQQARNEVRIKGVVEDIDVIATVLATTRLLNQSPMPVAQVASQATSMQFPETFAEWTANYSLANHNDQFLAAMMYLREKQQMNSVVTDDIVQLYKKARWEMPKNPADVMGKAANRHFIAEAENQAEDGKKHWQMTKTGYDYFQGLHKETNNGN
jgi:hypothetical protein